MTTLPRNAGKPARLGLPDLGCGVGFRTKHYGHVFEHRPEVDFFEVISENFMVSGGGPLHNLERLVDGYPTVQHGVSLGIGAVTPLDFDYLRRLKELTRRTKTPWITDHLCWTRADGADLHDLLPLPYTDEAVKHVAERIRIVQDFVELPFGVENVSSYMSYSASVMSEWAFLNNIVEEADCGMLLDINNIYVSAFNHSFDAKDYIDGLPHHRILQYHLAGHTHQGTHIIDTHSDFVLDEVWALYRYACEQTGNVSTLVEWDEDIPDFDTLHRETLKAAAIRNEVAATQIAPPAAKTTSNPATSQLGQTP